MRKNSLCSWNRLEIAHCWFRMTVFNFSLKKCVVCGKKMSFSSANSSTDGEQDDVANDNRHLLREILQQDIKSLGVLDLLLHQVSVLTERMQTIAETVTVEKKPTVLVKERRRRNAESGGDNSISASPVRVAPTGTSNLIFEAEKVPVRSSSPRLFDLLRRKPNSLNTSPISSSHGLSKTTLAVSARRNFEMLEQKPIVLHRRIGDGATAYVYEASVGNLLTAAKIYHQHFSGDNCVDKERDRRMLNIDTLCSLADHDNILTTFAMRFENNRLVALNQLAHCTLADLLDSSDIVGNTAESVEHVIKHLASALLFLHEGCANNKVKSIIHRDIKPANVFCTHRVDNVDWVNVGQSAHTDCKGHTDKIICNNWQHYTFSLGDLDEAHMFFPSTNAAIDWVPADSDFINSDTDNFEPTLQTCRSDSSKSDLSKSSSKSSLASSDTMITRIKSPRCATSNRDPIVVNGQKMIERLELGVGTPEYMAPEIADNDSATYDTKADIWSLGMVIYEMMTLKVPHAVCDTKMSRFQLHDIVASGTKPIIPKDVLQNVRWQKVLQIYGECTKVDPRKRASASEILKML